MNAVSTPSENYNNNYPNMSICQKAMNNKDHPHQGWMDMESKCLQIKVSWLYNIAGILVSFWYLTKFDFF